MDKIRRIPKALRRAAVRFRNFMRKVILGLPPYVGPSTGGFSNRTDVGNVSIRWTDAKQIAVAVGTSMHVVELLPLVVPSIVRQEDFTFTRAVIDFEVLDAPGGDSMQNFTPPLRLYLPWTHLDLATAGGPGLLTFAFWDENNKWVVFDKNKHSFTRLRPDGPGSFVFWDTEASAWSTLQPQGDFFTIGGQQVPRAELGSVYEQVISSFADPDGNPADGFAFAKVDSWGDRVIAAGHIPRTLPIRSSANAVPITR